MQHPHYGNLREAQVLPLAAATSRAELHKALYQCMKSAWLSDCKNVVVDCFGLMDGHEYGVLGELLAALGCGGVEMKCAVLERGSHGAADPVPQRLDSNGNTVLDVEKCKHREPSGLDQFVKYFPGVPQWCIWWKGLRLFILVPPHVCNVLSGVHSFSCKTDIEKTMGSKYIKRRGGLPAQWPVLDISGHCWVGCQESWLDESVRCYPEIGSLRDFVEGKTTQSWLQSPMGPVADGIGGVLSSFDVAKVCSLYPLSLLSPGAHHLILATWCSTRTGTHTHCAGATLLRCIGFQSVWEGWPLRAVRARH